MKLTSLLSCLLLACSVLNTAAATMTITSNPGTNVTVNFILGAANTEEGVVSSSFTFTTSKGLLGPSFQSD